MRQIHHAAPLGKAGEQTNSNKTNVVSPDIKKSTKAGNVQAQLQRALDKRIFAHRLYTMAQDVFDMYIEV
jgi:hypothetical protein